MPIPNDPDLLTEINQIYDEAVTKKRGEVQLMAILAQELVKARVVAEAGSNNKFEWPVV
jgi:hypothetical protein